MLSNKCINLLFVPDIFILNCTSVSQSIKQTVYIQHVYVVLTARIVCVVWKALFDLSVLCIQTSDKQLEMLTCVHCAAKISAECRSVRELFK